MKYPKKGADVLSYCRRSNIVAVIVLAMMITAWLVMPAAGAYGPESLSRGDRGTYVSELQTDLTRLGYSTSGVDGIFGNNTYSALRAFQKSQGIEADGIAGPATKSRLQALLSSQVYIVKSGDTLSRIAGLYGTSAAAIMSTNGLTSSTIYPGQKLIIGKANSSDRGSGRVELVDWWTVASKVFARGDVATVTDVATGISYQVLRSGGTNHADVQPLTAADTVKIKKIYGGAWSWSRRAIIVTIDGRSLAASQNGMPHGNQTIYNNDFPGHFCIHFLNSRTHGTNRVDAAHQAAIQRAAAY